MKTWAKSIARIVVAIMMLLSSTIELAIIDTSTKVSLFTFAYVISQNRQYHHHQQPQKYCFNSFRLNSAATLQRQRHPWMVELRLWKCSDESGSGCNDLYHHCEDFSSFTTSRQRQSVNTICRLPRQHHQSVSNTCLWMMNTNERNDDEDSELLDSSSNEPFYASASLTSSTTPSTTDSKFKLMEDSATSILSTASLSSSIKGTTGTTTTKSTSSRRPIPSTTSTSDDPVLAMADSFVDVFASFGKLFSNMFSSNNKNDNESNTVTTVDTTLNVAEPSKEIKSKEEPNKSLTPMTEPHSAIPSAESTYSSASAAERIDQDTDKTTAFMNDIVASLLMNEQQEILQQQAAVAFESSATATAVTSPTDTTLNGRTPSISANNDSDNDDDSLQTIYKNGSASLTNDSSLSSEPPIENMIDTVTAGTQNDTSTIQLKTDEHDSDTYVTDTTKAIDEMIIPNDSDAIVQEVNGWVTTTTTTTSFSEDDNDGGVVVVYDVDELDSWNQPFSPTESTTNVDDDSNTMAAMELEALTFTMTPSIDENDYFDENGNEICMTESDEIDDPKNNKSRADPTIATITSISEDIKDVEMIKPPSPNPIMLDTSESSVELSEELKITDNGMFESTDVVGNGADDVVLVLDNEELDSWKMGENFRESGYVQLDATASTITETNADGVESDYVECLSKDEINPFDDFVTPTEKTVIENFEDTDEDAFSDEDWQASIQMAQQSMSEKISGKMIDFDAPDQGDDNMGNEDKLECESAEELAKSQNDAPPLSAGDNSLDNDVDMEALAKAARDAVAMFEQKYETEKQATKRQRELWTAQQSSLPDNIHGTHADDVTMAQSLADMKSNWNKMTLSELKVELGDRGLAKSGTKAKLVARLVEHQSMTAMKIAGEGINATSFQSDASATDDGLRDWTMLKVAELKAELSRRGLSTSGKKSDLAAALFESDVLLQIRVTTEPNIVVPVKSDLRNTAVNEDIDQVALAAREAVAMFEQTNGRIDDIEDFDDIYESADDLFETDEDIIVDDLDLEALGKVARDAVLKMEGDEDEPSDEALWEIENEIAMVDDSFLVPPDDEIEQLSMMIGTIDPVKVATPKTQQRSDPPPNYASMAVSQLKEELNRRGLRVTGKKIDLIARLEVSDKELY